MKDFARSVIDAASLKGVDYADVRVVEERRQEISVKNQDVEGISDSSNHGFGVRVLIDGRWGFSSCADMNKKSVSAALKEAVEIAKSSAFLPGPAVKLTYLKPQQGSYRTDVKEDPFAVSLETKIDTLLSACRILTSAPKAKIARGNLEFFSRYQVFASTEGALTDQNVVISGGGVTVYAFKDDAMQQRSYPSAMGGNYRQAGFEFIRSMEFSKHAERCREEALALLDAPACPSGKTTLIIGSNQMVLQVHESIGHPAELDRILGSEVSYAGESFIRYQDIGKLRYGSEKVNVTADATIPGGLGTFGFDDEGVQAKRFFLIKDGMLTDLLSSRDTASVIGSRSNGTMRADGWGRIPLIRMTNINLEPGNSSLEEMIADTKQGIYLDSNKSWSIDNKRLNFQFATEIGWRIKNGKIAGMVRDPVYYGITPEFWGCCDAVGSKKERVLWGVPNCGKGEPGQTARVGHATVPARFRDVQVGAAQG